MYSEVPKRCYRMICRRLSRLGRRGFLAFCLMFIVLVYYQLSLLVYGPWMWKNKHRCKNSEEESKALQSLIVKTHHVLNNFNVTHFLAYGSLWGAYRYQSPLPWDYDFDFGIVKEDLLHVDIARLAAALNREGISLEYSYYAGNYKVTDGVAHGDLMIFSDFYGNGIMRRVGFESYLLFVHYRFYHEFPSRLVEKPLPTIEFVGLKFEVPREGIEIQKYFYRKNWWIELKPPGCTL